MCENDNGKERDAYGVEIKLKLLKCVFERIKCSNREDESGYN